MSSDFIKIDVKVVPGAKKNRVVGWYGKAIKVQVSAPPEKGKANSAVAEVLAEFLGIRSSQIVLASGAANPRKQFRLSGLTLEQLNDKMQVFS